MRSNKLGRTMWLAAFAILVAGLSANAQTPPPVGTASVVPQIARVWFYRDLNPNESLAEPLVRIDGAVIGTSEPGAAFYRDLAPGRHRLSVDSYYNDKYQTIEVDAVPGAELYVRVVPNGDFVEGGGEFSGGYHRNSYVLWLYPPEVARPVIARSRLAAAAPR